ncbi:hypothetical protein [Marinobacter sp.]|uniref:hypothetical protein n=1 Tax=Marinobacter sp. TaxID=50741 RepID=UPI00384AAA67
MSESATNPHYRFSFALPFLIAAALFLSGCATKPEPPFRLDTPTASPRASHTTFNTEIVPAPGRIEVLDWMHHEVTRQMKDLGYEVAEEDPDLRIRIRMERTDQITTVLEQVDSARIWLEMKADGEVLREGHTPNLTTAEMDMFSRGIAEDIVEEFLDRFPKRSN